MRHWPGAAIARTRSRLRPLRLPHCTQRFLALNGHLLVTLRGHRRARRHHWVRPWRSFTHPRHHKILNCGRSPPSAYANILSTTAWSWCGAPPVTRTPVPSSRIAVPIARPSIAGGWAGPAAAPSALDSTRPLLRIALETRRADLRRIPEPRQRLCRTHPLPALNENARRRKRLRQVHHRPFDRLHLDRTLARPLQRHQAIQTHHARVHTATPITVGSETSPRSTAMM